MRSTVRSDLESTHAERDLVQTWRLPCREKRDRRSALSSLTRSMALFRRCRLMVATTSTKACFGTKPYLEFEEVPAPRVHTLMCGVIYISEGKDTGLLDKLANIAHTTTLQHPTDMNADPGAALVTDFRDPIYNRTSFTIGGTPKGVAAAAIAVCKHALSAIDLRKHEANHPRLGVIDHVSLHPVGLSIKSDVGAAKVGKKIARTLGKEGVPVLLYGDLKEGKRLSEVRRTTPYFSSGAIPETVEADIGPNEVDPAKGIATIGSLPMLANYNMLLDTKDKRVAAAVTRSVRERDGGLPWVQALTLRRDDGRYETACTLLQPSKTTPAMVLAKAKAQAELSGTEVVEEYSIGLDEQDGMRQIVMAMLTRPEQKV